MTPNHLFKLQFKTDIHNEKKIGFNFNQQKSNQKRAKITLLQKSKQVMNNILRAKFDGVDRY